MDCDQADSSGLASALPCIERITNSDSKSKHHTADATRMRSKSTGLALEEAIEDDLGIWQVWRQRVYRIDGPAVWLACCAKIGLIQIIV